MSQRVRGYMVPLSYRGDQKKLKMYATVKIVENLVSKHQIQPEYGDEKADAGPSRETKFSGAKEDGEIRFFPWSADPVNLNRLMYTLLNVMTIL